jgi:hypothetical protein
VDAGQAAAESLVFYPVAAVMDVGEHKVWSEIDGDRLVDALVTAPA